MRKNSKRDEVTGQFVKEAPHNRVLGKKFNRWTVLGFSHQNKMNQYFYSCRCDCGNTAAVKISALTGGLSKSCGCLQREKASEMSTTHGLTGHKLYRVYQSILQRCSNPKNIRFHRYGGRGISVCDEWTQSFEVFYKDCIVLGWCAGLSIDRIDNDGNYSPQNCRFVTKKQNSRNSCTAKKWVVYGTLYQSLKDAAKSLNVCDKTIRHWCGCVPGRKQRAGCYSFSEHEKAE